jgi:hypothetical protein
MRRSHADLTATITAQQGNDELGPRATGIEVGSDRGRVDRADCHA